MKKVLVAKPGKDAFSRDPDDLTFSSDYNTFKYDINGDTTVYIPASASAIAREDVLITHNLGYYPFFVSYMEVNPGSAQYCNLPYSFADAGTYFRHFCYATTTQLILRTEASGLLTGIPFTVWFKIFRNNLNVS